jgi:PhoH-like ATPase
MRKAFILDTNVLLFDPQAFLKFGNNDVVIPIVVIEEIDRFKRESTERTSAFTRTQYGGGERFDTC